tara:strand:+ start:337 stop:756 length:420 start_codon:yes stop_codon:yes gene_type:complete
MLGVSQKVVIDSIGQTTLLDKRATIAQGNISKQRDSLLSINYDQQRLIDSLRKESSHYKKEADTLRSALNNIRFAIREKDLQIESKKKDLSYREKLFKADLKALKRKRLGLGVSIGYGLANEGQSMFAGLSLNYTLIRL